MRRSRPPVYRGKPLARGFKAGARKHWKKQKLASILHFRRQTEEELKAPEFGELTQEWEFITESSAHGTSDAFFLMTEDNYTLIAEQT